MSHKNVTKIVWYILVQLSNLIEKIPSTNLQISSAELVAGRLKMLIDCGKMPLPQFPKKHRTGHCDDK
jgi:hypothetical protein